MAASAPACGGDERPAGDGGGGADGAKDGGPAASGEAGTNTPVNPGDPGGPLAPLPEKWTEDATDSANLPGDMLDRLRDAATRAGAGSVTGGANSAPSSCSELLYPYDGAGMPGGLISPPFMVQTPFDAAYVRAGFQSEDRLDYEYAVASADPGELRIPAAHWVEITRRSNNFPLVLTFAFARGSDVTTCVTRLQVARGTMQGALYYNTYNHPLTAGTGAVLRLTLGEPESELYLRDFGVQPTGPCVSCHSLSSDGSTLAASLHTYGASAFSAKSFDATDDVQPQIRADVQDATFGGITRDGSAILRIGNPDCTNGANAFPRSKNNFPLALGPTRAVLVDTDTGAEIPSTGLASDHFYWMPQFSPDGKHVVFNDARLVNGVTERRELGVADYDPTSHTFSNQRTLVSADMLSAHGAAQPSRNYEPSAILLASLSLPSPGYEFCLNDWADDPQHVGRIVGGSCDGPCYPAWPFFTPDSKAVIFSLTSEPDFTVAFPGRDVAAKSELWYVDVETGAMVRLDNANKGLAATDALTNYYPTVLPVQVGGYFWMFWTSTRAFGHRSLEAPADAILSNGLFGSTAPGDAFKKRIWAAAIVPPEGGEFHGGALSDPSRPPFYLEGQSNTGNIRAFATLSPCRPAGDGCMTGLDCCDGFCSDIDATTGLGTCGKVDRCAQLNERCETDANCCPSESSSDPSPQCIGGYCGFILR